MTEVSDMQHKIVFVDDEEVICELYADIFNFGQYSVKSFVDTDEAIDYIKNNKISMCFLDYRMPKIKGDELRKYISEDVPCLMLTGEFFDEIPDGFLEVVSKPMDIDLYEELVEKYSLESSV